jgi:hypothetical protein
LFCFFFVHFFSFFFDLLSLPLSFFSIRPLITMRAVSCASVRTSAMRSSRVPALSTQKARRATAAAPLLPVQMRAKAAQFLARATNGDDDKRFDPDAPPSLADSDFAGIATIGAFVAVIGASVALLVSLAKPVIDNTLNSIPVR